MAFTRPAGPVGATNATLNGIAVPKGSASSAWFEWGTDDTYGAATGLVDVGASNKVVQVSALVQDLTNAGVFHFRLVVSNAFGIAYGMDRSLTTGMRYSTWSDYYYDFYPGPLPGLSNLVVIASGHAHSLGLLNDGTVVAWPAGLGFYDYGQTNVPVGLTNVIAVAGGWSHSLALKQDGTVVAWGLFENTAIAVRPPVTLSNVIAVAGGDSHSLALKKDGTVTAWGFNASGQTSVPFNLTNVVAIAAGSTHSLALRSDGKVISWGTAGGSGSIIPPVWLTNVVAIASETWHNLALRTDGTVVAWGDNTSGQTNVPAGLSNVVAIAAGFRHSLALKSDGTLVAWGASSYVTNVPTGLSNVVAISSGDYNSVALASQNFPPRVFSRSISGLPNSDLIIPFSGWDPNGDRLTFRIAGLPTAGSLYQFTSTGRGTLVASVDTPVEDPLNRLIFAPAPDAMNAPYATFNFVAYDGQVFSTEIAITVNIIPPPVLLPAVTQQGVNSGFSLSFSGFSNVNYLVSASTNLVNWTILGLATQSSPQLFYFLDASVTNRPERFYRVITR